MGGLAASVIVALHDHGVREQLLHCLHAQTQSLDTFEVILVDAEHRDDWTDAVARLVAGPCRGLNVRFERIAKGGRARAWNHGLARTTADVVILLADDYEPAPGWLAAHVRAHREHPEETLVALGPNYFPAALRTPFRAWLEDSGALYGASFTRPENWSRTFFYGANASFQRQLLRRVGLFDEAYPYHAWDDHEFGVRLRELGARIEVVPDAVASHQHPVDLAERIGTMRISGESAWVFHRTRPLAANLAKAVRRPAWAYRVNAAMHRALFAVTRRPRHREYYWRRTLSAAFIDGYRAAKRNGGPTGMRSHHA